jgi:hypothetical protein
MYLMIDQATNPEHIEEVMNFLMFLRFNRILWDLEYFCRQVLVHEENQSWKIISKNKMK